MAEGAAGRIALLSIHPAYAEGILNGTKRVEFRRTPLAGDVTHVVIYATAPVQRVVGIFEVAGVDSVRPTTAWRKFRRVGGIEKAAFDMYYDGAPRAHVIQVRRPQRLAAPVLLTDLDPDLRPPQSFQYIDPKIIGKVLADQAPLQHDLPVTESPDLAGVAV